MPALPVLVSLIVSQERKKRGEDNTGDDFQPLESGEQPTTTDHRIDMQQDAEENVSPNNEKALAPVHPPKRR
ncbi:hypothetical protein FRC17_004632, partial [Serendipita sp. 399]